MVGRRHWLTKIGRKEALNSADFDHCPWEGVIEGGAIVR
jgi:hypothetical protein